MSIFPAQIQPIQPELDMRLFAPLLTPSTMVGTTNKSMAAISGA
jgi:hypothetical protein